MEDQHRELYLSIGGIISDAEIADLLKEAIICDLSEYSLSDDSESLANSAFENAFSNESHMELHVFSKGNGIFDQTVDLCVKHNLSFLLVVFEDDCNVAFIGEEGESPVMLINNGDGWDISYDDEMAFKASGKTFDMQKLIHRIESRDDSVPLLFDEGVLGMPVKM